MPSRSDDRACVVRGLVLHGYPDAEAAALAIHLCDYDDSTRKGAAWLYKDVDRLIAKERARPENQNIVPTPSRLVAPRPAQPLPDTPRTSRARKDRPQTIDAAGLLALYSANADADGVLRWDRAQAATAAKTSIPNLDRLERTVKADGAMARAGRGRGGSVIVLFNAINITRVPSATSQPAAAADAEPANAPADDDSIRSEHPNAVNTASRARTRRKEHTAPIVPSDLGPLRHASTPVIHEPLTVTPVEVDEWAQERIGPLPRRRRIADRPPAEQLQALKAQLGKVRARKRRQKRLGVDVFSLAGLERAAATLRAQIAELETTPRPSDLSPISETPPDAVQLAIDDAETVGPSAACVPPLPPEDSPYTAGYVTGMIARLRSRSVVTS
jgi:hypothetical protein